MHICAELLIRLLFVLNFIIIQKFSWLASRIFREVQQKFLIS